ncbi:PD40 domain-containing protein [Mariniblastus fucicola]|uniref:WD40-like Beta Propeller Repeat protein n=2 Tax=Mariniblastus fucicola TaxID=980251 RepID=A0A5B9PF28_9BACT|nr:PD40 domain-containing protein [Mariniblastus fucicola]QEG24149.1 WD40-like Beta Propeller Repeat protein [Mariniblastus fucicola]
MKKILLPAVCLLLLTISLATSSHAQTKSALGALAVSPDGKTLVAAGYNRVMYVCNPDDLTVNKRIYLNIVPYEAFFSSDGSSLVIFSSDKVITIYDTATWKRKAEIKKTYDIAIASKTNEMVVMHGTKYRDSKRFTPVAVYDLSTGEKKCETSFEMDGYAIGTNEDASQVIVISRARTDESEAKEKTPKELEGMERDEFEQKHDGRIADVLWLDGELKETNRYSSFYSDSGNNVCLIKDHVATFIVYRNRCATLSPDGDIKLFRTGTSYNYGIGVSPDGKTLASGGLATGMVMDIDKKTSISFDHPRLPGFPEYFYGFAFGADGTIYGGTSAWRIIKISPEGEVLSETPIF